MAIEIENTTTTTTAEIAPDTASTSTPAAELEPQTVTMFFPPDAKGLDQFATHFILDAVTCSVGVARFEKGQFTNDVPRDVALELVRKERGPRIATNEEIAAAAAKGAAAEAPAVESDASQNEAPAVESDASQNDAPATEPSTRSSRRRMTGDKTDPTNDKTEAK